MGALGASPAGKGGLSVGGRSMVARVVAAVGSVVGRVVVVIGPTHRLPPFDHAVDVVHDTSPDSGPLAGLADGLRHVGRAVRPCPSLAVVCPCDVPLLRPALVRAMLERAAGSGAAWTIPIVGGQPQLLLSVIRPESLAHVEHRLAAGRRDLRGLATDFVAAGLVVDRVAADELRGVDPRLESFADVDVPEDLRSLEDGGIPSSPP